MRWPHYFWEKMSPMPNAVSSLGTAKCQANSFAEGLFAQLAGYDRSCSPNESALRLRQLIRSGLLKFADMRDRPEFFFLAHRLLASRSTVLGGGFGIRFTVQFNLFAGSIIGLGADSQVEVLESMQRRGELGCFALTETDAGVMSGLIVETTATWESGAFTIHTPHPGAAKNWISQGLTADWVVIVAKLIVDGAERGPHRTPSS